MTEIWSEFARQTGLELDPGDPRAGRTSSVSGIYRGRLIFASTVYNYKVSTETNEACTNMWLEVENATGRRLNLNVSPRDIFDKIFSSGGSSSRHRDFDRRFKFKGHPDNFLKRATQLIDKYHGLLVDPNEVSSIKLYGKQLICLQVGVVKNIPRQVSILNLLCDLAELAEENTTELDTAQMDLLSERDSVHHKHKPGKPSVGLVLFVLFVVLPSVFFSLTALSRPDIAQLLYYSSGGLLFLGVTLVIMEHISRRQFKRLIGSWSELARQTGLKLDQGDPRDLSGISGGPNLRGTYRGRRVSVKRGAEGVLSGEVRVTDPGHYIYVSMEVKNAYECRLNILVNRRNIFDKVFRSGDLNRKNRDFDRRFRFDGHPDSFLQRARQLIARHSSLFDRPDGVITFVYSWGSSWKPPSVRLEGPRLICVQWGLPTQITGQVSILNLLCDLAELAEENR